jgi:hypothetical protein
VAAVLAGPMAWSEKEDGLEYLERKMGMRM